jgi:hypothetical protein
MVRAEFQMSHALRRAIERCGQSQTALAYPVGLTQSDLSRYLNGRPFGPRVRGKIESIGVSLGLPVDRCCRGLR